MRCDAANTTRTWAASLPLASADIRPTHVRVYASISHFEPASSLAPLEKGRIGALPLQPSIALRQISRTPLDPRADDSHDDYPWLWSGLSRTLTRTAPRTSPSLSESTAPHSTERGRRQRFCARSLECIVPTSRAGERSGGIGGIGARWVEMIVAIRVNGASGLWCPQSLMSFTPLSEAEEGISAGSRAATAAAQSKLV